MAKLKREVIMRICKVKLKDDGVELKYVEHVGKGERESLYKCAELIHPDLSTAFESLIPEVYEILGMPLQQWAGAMKVRGVSFSLSEENAVEGSVITALVYLPTTNSPLVINTPYLPFKQYSPTGESPLMPKSAVRKLEKLREEAEAYMDGKRAQMSLPLS